MTDKEKLLDCARKAEIEVGDYTITRVYDYGQVRNFLNLLEGNVHLGMDMSSLTCSGDVQICPRQEGYIRLIEKDNGSDDEFKFKGMLLLNSQLDNPDSSPEIFFESAYDKRWHEQYAKDGFKYLNYDDGRYLILEEQGSGNVIYKREEIEHYFEMEDNAYYYGGVQPLECKRITQNTYQEMVAYINVQQCKNRHRGNMILFKGKNLTCDELANAFAKKYRIV